MSGEKSVRSRSRRRERRPLYQRTVAGRLALTTRRTRRAAAVVAVSALVAGSLAATLAPAQAGAYGGFSATVTASPLKLEIYEPTIPIPTDPGKPQVEFDFSYTRALASTGPNSSARASAMWPGPSVGEGLKTFGDTLGLPSQLTANGYPVQVNAQYPSDTTQAADEPLPGMIQRVSSSETASIAKAAYSPAGDVPEGQTPSDGSSTSTSPLDALKSGDLSALGDALLGGQSGNGSDPVSTSPLGALSVVADFDGMTSISSARYDGDKVVARATSRLGEIRILGGLITLDGVNVVTMVTSTVDGGAKVGRTVDIGGMTVAGQKFAFGPEGFTAAGSNTPIPGLPTDADSALALLGVKIALPKPKRTVDGLSGSIEGEALRITVDTTVLHDMLPTLPTDQIFNNLPDLPGQANLLKSALLSLDTVAPKLVLRLGSASASAATVEPYVFDGGTGSTDTGGSVSGPVDTGTSTGGGAPAPSVIPDSGQMPSPDAGAPVTETVNTAAQTPGLPPLGSVPTLLLLAGLALAGATGWGLRFAGNLLFGAGATCTHGLKAGVPDLRKV